MKTIESSSSKAPSTSRPRSRLTNSKTRNMLRKHLRGNTFSSRRAEGLEKVTSNENMKGLNYDSTHDSKFRTTTTMKATPFHCSESIDTPIVESIKTLPAENVNKSPYLCKMVSILKFFYI